MADTSRVLVYDHADAFVRELPPSAVFERTRTETLNGERALTITTTVVLEREQRVLTCDATGRWREWVVVGCDAEHQAGTRAFGTYYCQWSLQHDLVGTVVDKMPGVQTPVTAAVALDAALSGTSRWSVGTVTQTATGGASMYYVSGWEALGIAIDTWGGELDAQITVSNAGVVTRKVALWSQMGAQTATRRFDYGRDLSAIRRKVDQSPVYCRIVPRGKGEDLGNGSYGRRITIESVNGGRNYIEDSDAAAAFRLPDGSGGWEYPTCIVVAEDIETPAELLAWGRSVLSDYTTPKVTYEATVEQLSQAGMDVKGLALGDACQCVDLKFGGAGLRVSGRVTKLVVNELDEGDVKVTIGYLTTGLVGVASALTGRIDSIQGTVSAINGGTMSTADYLTRLIDRLNTQISGTGGYAYIVEGVGLRTYDRAVSDPAVGAEATQVVEVSGGAIRIANSRTSAGEWDWRTVFVSGHIAADLVTAAHLTAGYIGSADSGNFIDLDNGEWRLSSIDVDMPTIAVQYAYGSSSTAAPTTGWGSTSGGGTYLWERTATTQDGTTTYSTPTCLGKVAGMDGQDGDDGRGITSAVTQWYLSTSSSTTTGGSWSATQQAYVSGRYYWMRQQITWSDGTTSYTTATLANGLNNANSTATEANGTANAAKSTADGVRTDFDALNTQAGIFNKLTNNGALQGLYMSGGYLYINASYINTGTFTVTSGGYTLLSANKTSGTVTVGGFTVSGSSLYSGKSSLTSNTYGVYMSTSGISVGSGSAYTALADGYLRGGNASDITGYVGFNNYWAPTGVYGTRLAGRGCIALLTNGAFGIGSYYNYGSSATITTGQSGTISVIYKIEETSGGGIRWSWLDVSFTKGLMTTAIGTGYRG